MALPTGTITMSDVNVELGKSSTALISLNDADVRSLAGVASGTISMDDLRGKSAGPEFLYTTTAPFYRWVQFTQRAGRRGGVHYVIRVIWESDSASSNNSSAINFLTDEAARDATTQITFETGDLSPFIYFKGDFQTTENDLGLLVVNVRQYAIGRLPL